MLKKFVLESELSGDDAQADSALNGGSDIAIATASPILFFKQAFLLVTLEQVNWCTIFTNYVISTFGFVLHKITFVCLI